MSFKSKHFLCVPALLISIGVVSCADKTDPATPAVSGHKSLAERLSESGGYKQDAEGNWVPNSDKRSSFDSQRESQFSNRSVEKGTYQTGDYAKKSWWGSKDYNTQEYSGNTDGSRFQTKARQDGQIARGDGMKAQLEGPFETNTLDRRSARESASEAIARPSNSYTEAQRNSYKAPSVIDWREQRSMSMDDSKGILGR